MKHLATVERFCLIAHLVSMAFGLAGLLLVLPHPEFVAALPPIGQQAFSWSMAGGGVVYILFGAAAVGLHGYRILGLGRLLAFLIPSVALSLSSELLGTSTGFPFGDYGYLSGLGYKIADLVPFTIPLSWFYMGLASYLLACASLKSGTHLFARIEAIVIGALLLTSWDFVLDPAMSQMTVAFWQWNQPGEFFGMPLQNFAGWMGTGVVFMTVAALLWGKRLAVLDRAELAMPLWIYVGNFAFAMIMSLAAGITFPVLLGMLLGLGPAVGLWWVARPAQAEVPFPETLPPAPQFPLEVASR
ncbi:gamma-carotene 1'-hydroxylase CruF [Leptolyngbya sp. FACHB-261]|uniref:gamma-carotene 1'-hydroxylase CruF n=1 Tax=Leptolyngbya sp. FACHB-261 TaxID=2692806 RepID=UPI00168450F4|nr:carotenoid biosynthesis protein [Leptolyngbya sp. FACHB-261]MBD2102959.1 carotenoid biosynthesis protein [Leptolyngbya sp. FACHB-261]